MTSFKKKICIISSSRAELGILKNLILGISREKFIKTTLIALDNHSMVAGKKLDSELKELQNTKIIKINLKSKIQTPRDITNRSLMIIKNLSLLFEKEKFDLVIFLGDRYEIFVSAYTAVLHKFPLIHISGGDETLGAYDNQFRHAISKLSNYHFVTNKFSKLRLEKMGEKKNNIFNYGSLSVEKIYQMKKIKKKNLEKSYNIRFKEKNFIVTYHPETLSSNLESKIEKIIKSLTVFKNYLFIFTSPNNDEGANKIKKIIKKYIKKYKNFVLFESFGQRKYFEFLKIVDGVIGNSSSGVHEAPNFNIGTVNIGNRQDGRIKLKSVINVNYSKKEIIKAIKKISSRSFRSLFKNNKNPYYKKNTTLNIQKKIKEILVKKIPIQKKFYE
jgi:UDP-hydrolysing UDP-N-acetyl-D-glucosamine 2-epimerase